MANPHRGEVELKAGDKSYVLVFSINALCEAEELVGVNILGDLIKLSTLRNVLWAGLRTKQPDVTKGEAGDMIQVLGVDAIRDIVVKAMALAFPPKEREKTVNPQ